MNSHRYALHHALYEVVLTTAGAHRALAALNPPLPVALPQPGWGRMLFLLDRGDELVDQPNQIEHRRTRCVIGALVRAGVSAALDVDQLHFATRIAMRGARTALAQIDRDKPAPILREVQIEPELRDLKSDGALLLSAYEIEYFETYPEA